MESGGTHDSKVQMSELVPSVDDAYLEMFCKAGYDLFRSTYRFGTPLPLSLTQRKRPIASPTRLIWDLQPHGGSSPNVELV
jgi:hypothetical protein